MKKFIASLIVLFAGAGLAQTPSYTPNIGLQVPAYGQQNWQVPLNYNDYLLDKLLSGNAVLPAINVSGLANFPQLTSWQVGNTYPSGAIVVYLGTFYVSLSNGNQGNLPTNATYWSTSVTGSGITSLAINVPSYFTSSCATGAPLTGPGTCTITSASITQNEFLASPNGTNGALTPRVIVPADLPVFGSSQAGIVPASGGGTTTYLRADGSWSVPAGGSGSAQVVYTSVLLGTTGNSVVAKNSASAGTDYTTQLNAALSGGNVRLVIDGQYAVGTLTLYSNTQIQCLPGMGLIQTASTNLPMFMNAHQNGATTASGTGYGYLVSNITDTNIDVGGADGNCTFNTQGQTKVNPSTSLWTTATRFLGIQDLSVSGHWINSAAYQVLYSNVDHAHFGPLWFDQTSAAGNDDGLHANGPVNDIVVDQVRCTNNGDDCVAFNADDGNESRFGDGNYPHVTWPGWKQGPITNVQVKHILVDTGGANVLRLLSVTELIDQFEGDDFKAVNCNDAFTLYHEYSSSYGFGNYGNIRLNGVGVQSNGNCTNGRQATFYVGGNFNNLEIDGYSMQNPSVNWPIIEFVDGTINNYLANGWRITNTTGTDANYIYFVGSALGNFNQVGTQWADNSSHVGTFFVGSAPPSLTCSNFAGPNRLLASGFVPTYENGDCYTNTYPAATVTYVNTIFNEATVGLGLAGTTPATCVGCSGGWTLASGTDFTYSGSDSISTSTANGGVFDLLNIGRATGVVRMDLTTCTGSGSTQCQVGLRYTNISNFIAVNINPPGTGNEGMYLYDVVGGSATAICNVSSAASSAGNYTFTLNGSAITASGPNGNCSGTTANTTATNLGISLSGSSMVLSSMSVKSN